MERTDEEPKWEWLNPETLRSRLTNVSLYIAAYELLEDTIKESEAIGQKDLVAFDEDRALRNKLVHELPQVLTKGLPSELGARFSELISLLDRIERWWIVNVDMAADPKFREEEIDHRSIIPGRILALHAMLDVASGSRTYLED